MSAQKDRRVLPFSQLLLILMGIMVLYMAADFVRQVAVSHQRQEELRQIEQRIVRAERETVELMGQLEYARSSDAVEAALRPQGLTREDEVLVVLVGAPENPDLDKEPELNTESGFGSPREAWWDLFFGTR